MQLWIYFKKRQSAYLQNSISLFFFFFLFFLSPKEKRKYFIPLRSCHGNMDTHEYMLKFLLSLYFFFGMLLLPLSWVNYLSTFFSCLLSKWNFWFLTLFLPARLSGIFSVFVCLLCSWFRVGGKDFFVCFRLLACDDSSVAFRFI